MKILLPQMQMIQKVLLLWFYCKGTSWLLQFPDSLHSLSLDLVQLRDMSVVYNVYFTNSQPPMYKLLAHKVLPDCSLHLD